MLQNQISIEKELTTDEAIAIVDASIKDEEVWVRHGKFVLTKTEEAQVLDWEHGSYIGDQCVNLFLQLLRDKLTQAQLTVNRCIDVVCTI